MKLTESQLRSIIRKELMKEMHGVGLGSAFPKDPEDLMQKLTDLTNQLHTNPEKQDEILSSIQTVAAEIKQARMQK